MSLQNLNFYIEKLYLINKDLGGSVKEEQKAKEADEFDAIKSLIMQNLHKTKKKMDEKMEKFEGFGKSAETLKLDIEIKDLFQEIEKMLGTMNEILRRQAKNSKKYSKNEIENKEKIYSNLRTQVKDLRDLDKESANVSFGVKSGGGETLTELKSRLVERPKNVEVRREVNEEEKQAMEQYKETDKKMDEFVDKISEGVNLWKVKAEKIGEQIDETTIRIGRVEKEVDKATSELMTTNKKLKAIVEKYRQPNKFCLDIVLLALLIGLIGVMIKMLAS